VLGAELRSGEALDLDLLAEHLPGADGTTAGPLRLRRIEGERRTLSEVLRQHSGKVTAAARSLGISRQAFYKALKRTGGRDGI
jgi:transcriptional regulator of acetoin/glycerol metabolism